jgi:hypothetical protein
MWSEGKSTRGEHKRNSEGLTLQAVKDNKQRTVSAFRDFLPQMFDADCGLNANVVHDAPSLHGS